MRACVIFNPTANGEKARCFRQQLHQIAAHVALRTTAVPGEARRLAADAVGEGFDNIVAAGGDGTLNEVLNGIGDARGFDRVRLGVLPLGTVNVFAHELGIPLRVEKAWDAVRLETETRIDLPFAEFEINGVKKRRYFVQLAGAGLDAQAIELVNWQIKKRFGPLAYIIAGLHALLAKPSKITVTTRDCCLSGELILIGNGRFYGGRYELFPQADLRDGLLEVCAFPRVNWLTLARCGPFLLARGKVPARLVQRIRTESFTLITDSKSRFELDGELVGALPVTFSVKRAGLRVLVPSNRD